MFKVLVPQVEEVEEAPQAGQVDVGGRGQDELLELLLVVVCSPPALDFDDPLRLLLEDLDTSDLENIQSQF